VLDRADAADLMDVVRHELGFSTKEKRFPRKARVSRHLFVPGQYPAVAEANHRRTVSLSASGKRISRVCIENMSAASRRIAFLNFDDLLLYWHVMMQNPALAQSLCEEISIMFWSMSTRTPAPCRPR